MTNESRADGLLARITRNPQVMAGLPCIRGMRLTVGVVLGLLDAGYDAAGILALYPYLEPEDIEAARAYADL